MIHGPSNVKFRPNMFQLWDQNRSVWICGQHWVRSTGRYGVLVERGPISDTDINWRTVLSGSLLPPQIQNDLPWHWTNTYAVRRYYFLTEPGSSWHANYVNSLYGKLISYRDHKRPPLDPILSQLNVTNNLTSQLFKYSFSINPSSTPEPLTWSLLCRFSFHNVACASLLATRATYTANLFLLSLIIRIWSSETWRRLLL